MTLVNNTPLAARKEAGGCRSRVIHWLPVRALQVTAIGV